MGYSEFTVALLSDDEFGCGLVALGVNHGHRVGVTLDLSAVGQVAKPGPPAALFFVLLALAV
jgi:hypothetical protein